MFTLSNTIVRTIRGMSHLCVRIIVTLCIKVDRLFELKIFLSGYLLQCELSLLYRSFHSP